MPPPSLYDSDRLAWGYAYCRPPVHAQVVAVIRERLRALGRFAGEDTCVARALDVGCGAGLSTAALAPLARQRVGLEPVRTMLRHCGDVAPGASFVVGRAEHLPFADRSFDLVTAAGSLNYADIGVFLPSAARVLADRGLLVVYDFSSGRRLAGDRRLADWFAAFEQRYPFPPGYAMDVRRFAYADAGLRLESYEEFDVAVPMTPASYLTYVLSETNVARAISCGAQEQQISAWCRTTLGAFFPEPSGDVLFAAYVAVVGRGR